MEIRLTKALPEHARYVYDIAMTDQVRSMSTRSDHFTFPQHLEWFTRRTTEPQTLFLIVLGDGSPIGYLRYGKVTAEDRAEISFAIEEHYRGRRLAARVLLTGEDLARETLRVHRVTGLVLLSNVPSVRAFIAAGYSYVGTEERMGKVHLRFDKRLAPPS